MNISTTHIVYFSPTGTTQKVLREVGASFGTKYIESDLTDRMEQGRQIEFSASDLLIVGVPVYGGRVPQTACERFETMHGQNTPAVIITTFGNRDFDDALLELKTIMTAKGFSVIAAAALSCEHSIVPVFGAGRPDEADRMEMSDFSKQVAEKIMQMDENGFADIKVPGNKEYRKYNKSALPIKTKRKCTHCQTCVKKCPVGAIPTENPRETEKEKCISCLRCIKVCPAQARHLPALIRFMARRGLKEKCSGRKANHFYI